MNVYRKIFTYKEAEDLSPHEKWSLEQMQEFVGGYIELVRIRIPHRSLIVNEEGWLKEMPVNIEASKLAGQTIVGNALLVSS
jgi:hypothetical protein